MADYWTIVTYKGGEYQITLFYNWTEPVSESTHKVWYQNVVGWTTPKGIDHLQNIKEIEKAIYLEAPPLESMWHSPNWPRLRDAKQAVKRAIKALGRKRWGGIIEWDRKWYRD
jgi:hypothetical protein